MRRPGNLAGSHYWFGDVSRPKPTKSFVDRKLAEINGAKIKNGTPLTEREKRSRLLDVLNGAKPKNITG